ncbi:MAG: hypothetical protein V1900_03875 [Candidatus Aenigmatarchaeota archaeon]
MKILSLISGGIDSPVAAAMLARKHEVILLHFYLYPYYVKESLFLTVDAMKRLEKFGIKKVIIFPWKEVFDAMGRGGKYRCVLCKKSMFKAAELVCKKEKASAIATGEALAQKASQTLDNLYATSYGIKVPIHRPLLGLDKNEIIEISRKFGLFSEKHAGCCKVIPYMPSTKADAMMINGLYKELKLQKIIEKNLKKTVEVKIEKLDYTITDRL